MSLIHIPKPSPLYRGWYEIPGFASCCADYNGQILTKKTGHVTRGGNAGRYLKVSAYKDDHDKPSLYHVHDMVCRAFHGLAPNPGMVVMHRNNNRWDNRPTNLSWGTQSQNILDVYKDGLRKARVALEQYTPTPARALASPVLYHLSFNERLTGKWRPMHPAGSASDGVATGPYPEFNCKRISTSSSIEGAFRGVYPNLASFFETQHLPYLDFFVYQPVFRGTERVLDPVQLTKGRLVWDAYATGEHAILDPCHMALTAKVRVFNTNASPTRMGYPYGDTSLPKVSLGPNTIKWKWLLAPKDTISQEAHPVYCHWSA